MIVPATRIAVLVILGGWVGMLVAVFVLVFGFPFPYGTVAHLVHVAVTAGGAAGWTAGLGWTHVEVCRRVLRSFPR